MVFIIILFMLSIIILLMMYIYSLKVYGPTNNQTYSNNTDEDDLKKTINNKKKKKDVHDMFEIIGFQNNYIEMADGSIKAILEISTDDVQILNNDEQTKLENALLSAIRTIDNIQFFSTSEKMKTIDLGIMEDTIKKTHNNDLCEYTKMLKNKLVDLKKKYQIRNYCIVEFRKRPSQTLDDKEVVNKLDEKTRKIIMLLHKAKIRTTVLSTLEISQLFYNILNLNQTEEKISDHIDIGALELYTNIDDKEVVYE